MYSCDEAKEKVKKNHSITSPALNIILCLSKKSKTDGDVSCVSIPVPTIYRKGMKIMKLNEMK